MKKLIIGISGFLILNIYFNVSTHFISNSMVQLLCLLLFFPLANFIARLNGLTGLNGFGLQKGHKHLTYFLVSFLIGFGIWSLMYAVYYNLNKFEISGMKGSLEAGWILVQVVVGFFLGSLINDIITRGYVIGLLRSSLQPLAVGLISVLVYALDDFWNGDFTMTNIVFSVILGCSLTFAFYKTGSLWANTGIHFGLNVAYGLLYGLSGSYDAGIFIVSPNTINPAVNNIVLLTTPMFLFAAVVFYYNSPQKKM